MTKYSFKTSVLSSPDVITNMILQRQCSCKYPLDIAVSSICVCVCVHLLRNVIILRQVLFLILLETLVSLKEFNRVPFNKIFHCLKFCVIFTSKNSLRSPQGLYYEIERHRRTRVCSTVPLTTHRLLSEVIKSSSPIWLSMGFGTRVSIRVHHQERDILGQPFCRAGPLGKRYLYLFYVFLFFLRSHLLFVLIIN